jgi:hypothetical protein
VACKLGCDPRYDVSITYRGGKAAVGTFEFERLQWARELNDVSEARVLIPPSCCGRLADADAWSHELHISRNGDEVWAGPIVTAAACRSGTTIVARDMLEWLGHRVIHEGHVWPEDPGVGAVQAAVELIEDGFAPDDPEVLKYLHAVGIGVVGGREYPANSAYVLDALKDLAKGALDFTAVGRRIVVLPQGASLGRTTILTCDAFQGDVCTASDGLAAVTRGVVTGDEETGVTGSYGGVDPYYGLLEALVEDTAIKSNATAAAQARGMVNGRPPVLVQPPDSGSLAPDAPVCLEQLVPGVTVPVVVDCTCRTVAQDLRLTSLSVTVDAAGERVSPVLSPIGVDVAA